jgi:2-iminoacetate synthase
MIRRQGYEAVWKDWDASLFLNQAKHAFDRGKLAI